MAKKVSTLVVPVKLDTSGMNAGLNEMKSKMSRVRGSGGGGGGGAMGGSAPGFASGVVPFGVGGGSSSAAAAMAAAFGASMGRGSGGVADMSKAERVAYNSQTKLGEVFQQIANFNQAKISSYGAANAKIKDMINSGAYTVSKRTPRTPAEIATQNYRIAQNEEFARQKRSNQAQIQKNVRSKARFQKFATKATEFAEGMDEYGNLTSGIGAGLVAGERLLKAISPQGIAQTMSDLRPFETRKAGQYDIAQGMRSRAQTATEGNLTMGQQFLLGAGTAAGIGGVTRTEQMGAGLYEGLGTVAAVAGSGLEKTLSAGVGAVEGFLQRAAVGGYLSNPFNYIRRIMN